MTQESEEVKKVAELNSLFMTLNDKGKESALIILRSLGFAQSVMCSSETGQPWKIENREK